MNTATNGTMSATNYSFSFVNGTLGVNKAALTVYETIRKDGTQQAAVPIMQTRDELYATLDYHAYEKKLDELFGSEKEK